MMVSHLKRASSAFFCLFFLSVSGCTNVYVADKNGKISVERYFGFIQLGIPNDSTLQAVRLEGFGLLTTNDGLSVGYHNGSMLAASADCKIVLIVNTSQNLETLIDMLKGHGKVCALSENTYVKQPANYEGEKL